MKTQRTGDVPHDPLAGDARTALTGTTGRWYRFLSWWVLLAGTAYLGLIVFFITLVQPAGRGGSLPREYLELAAATRDPGLYRLTIAFDVAAWLGMGGVLIAIAAVFFGRAPIRSTFIAALGIGTLVGFFGACLRLAGTTDLAARYLAATATHRVAELQSYLDLQQQINVSFSAGGLLIGLALVLAASIAWRVSEFPRWVTVLLALAGVGGIVKAGTELTTGADLGPLGLLSATLLIISFPRLAGTFRRQVPAGGVANAPAS
jgi:Domain of unknown function (DUF4386)